MRNPKLSIVVLVYKTAHLLNRCLDSIIFNGGYSASDVEIIIVNDCSPDNAEKVILDYLSSHKWCTIKYIKRTCNGGEAAARNSGLEYVSGEYYTYVDSDDCVTDSYINEILRVISDYKPDMISYRYEWCDESGKRLGVQGERREALLCNSSARMIRSAFSTFSMSLRCNSVVKCKCIAGLRYKEHCKLGIDGLFNFEAYLRASTFYMSNKVLYKYYQYSFSATHNFSEEKVHDLLLVHQYYIAKLQTLPYFSIVSDLMCGFFFSNYFTWVLDEVSSYESRAPAKIQYYKNLEELVRLSREYKVVGLLQYCYLKWAITKRNLHALYLMRIRLCSERMRTRIKSASWTLVSRFLGV